MKLLTVGETIAISVCTKLIKLPIEIREKAYQQILEEMQRHKPHLVNDLKAHEKHILKNTLHSNGSGGES